MSAPVLYTAVSYHGYGHVAQTAPVVNALRRLRPDLRLVLQCAAPHDLLRTRFEGPFEHVSRAPDFGMRMESSLDVLARASHDDYLALHENWPAVVAEEWSRIATHAPDLIVANVPYLTLAAARLGGVPAVGLASLDWAHVYAAYCGELPGASSIIDDMMSAYASASVILNPEPSMSMPGLQNLRSIGPIARTGQRRRSELLGRCGCGEGARLVALFLGGVATPLPLACWPAHADLHWLVPEYLCSERSDMSALERLGVPYVDVVASADALVTKPGYGSFVEAACHGVPVLYVRRPGWPEEPYLVDWLTGRATCLEVTRAQLERGELATALERLWSLPRVPAVPATGAMDAAAALAALLPD